MTPKEFRETCKATIPNGYFVDTNFSKPRIVFMYNYPFNGRLENWNVAVYNDNGKAGTCSGMPWDYDKRHVIVSTGDREQFALNLKEVMPPKGEAVMDYEHENEEER